MEPTQPPMKIAVLTSGGDSPGMNAAIRAVVRCSIDAGVDALGVRRGFEGLLESDFVPLPTGAVGGILDRGGTFLGTSRSERFATPEGVAQAAAILREAGVTGLVVVGGDGSYRGAYALAQAGIAVAALPGTIDNDLGGTSASIGFDTALNTVIEAVAKVRDTASSYERTFVIEVMGRATGLLATYAGLASGADCVLVPEIEWRLEDVCDAVMRGVARGKRHSLIMVAEGAGSAPEIAERLSAACGQTVRSVVLGYIQRGGSPSAFDRILASRMGARAVEALVDGERGFAVGDRKGEVLTYPLEEAFACSHPLREEVYRLTRVLGQ